jgi:lysophospholipase L1-like esterase
MRKLVLIFSSCLAFAAQTNSFEVLPIERTDSNSRMAHEQLLTKAKTGKIDVYFLGDSITRRWGCTDPQYRELLENWKTNFFGWNAANFGWGADRIENILWRVENGELDGVNPKIIVILAGINNVGNMPGDPDKAARIASATRALLNACQKKASKATFILTGILPRNDNMAVVPVINEINSRIASFADGKSVRYININQKIADADGKFFEAMVNTDKLHPSIKTYQVWADALKPIFTEILGPPATTDLAPQPTGDPSVTKK